MSTTAAALVRLPHELVTTTSYVPEWVAFALATLYVADVAPGMFAASLRHWYEGVPFTAVTES